MIKEQQEIMTPFIAYCYASAAVVFKANVFRIIATVLHVAPSIILRCIKFLMCLPEAVELFFSKASTAFCIAGSQLVSSCNSCAATFAKALPLNLLASSVFSTIYNSKSPESLSGNVGKIVRCLTIKTSTTLCPTRNQGICKNVFGITTDASAFPHNVPMLVTDSFFNNSQSFKGLTRKVKGWSSHGFTSWLKVMVEGVYRAGGQPGPAFQE